MAKATIEVDDREIEVKFTLNEQVEVEELSGARDKADGTDVDLTRNDMRGKVLDALNALLDTDYEKVEFEDGEDPSGVSINPETGGAEFADDQDPLDEEPSTTEIADACREVLDPDTCDEIAIQETTEDALGLAFTALIEAGEDPEEFLKSKNILIESMPKASEPSKEGLEAKKREVLIFAMDEAIPALAKDNIAAANESARKVLKDIQEGNNPDLEPAFRKKMQKLGINLDS